MTKPFEWYNTNYITITPTNLNNLGVYYRGADATTGISGIADKSYKGFLLRNSVLSGNTNGGRLVYLTNNTKFLVVDGSGTDTCRGHPV